MLLVQAAPIKQIPVSESDGRMNLRRYLGSARNANTNRLPQVTPSVFQKFRFECVGWFQNSIKQIVIGATAETHVSSSHLN